MDIKQKILTLSDMFNATDVILHGETYGTINQCVLWTNNCNTSVSNMELDQMIYSSLKLVLHIVYVTDNIRHELYYTLK